MHHILYGHHSLEAPVSTYVSKSFHELRKTALLLRYVTMHFPAILRCVFCIVSIGRNSSTKKDILHLSVHQ